MAQSTNIVPNLYTGGNEFTLNGDDYSGPMHYKSSDDTYWTYATPEYGIEASLQLFPTDPNFRDLDGYMISPYNTTKTITATLGIPEYTDVEEVLDTEIKELLPSTSADDGETTTPITPGDVDTDTFFQIYETIKGDIPNSGDTESHTYLLNSSLTQLGDDVLEDTSSVESNSGETVTTGFTTNDFTVQELRARKHALNIYAARVEHFEGRLNEITEVENEKAVLQSEVNRLQTGLTIVKDNINIAIGEAFGAVAEEVPDVVAAATAFNTLLTSFKAGTEYNTGYNVGVAEGVASVDIASDNAGLIQQGVDSVTFLQSSYDSGYAVGLADGGGTTTEEELDGWSTMPSPEENASPTFGDDEYTGPDDVTWYWWPTTHKWSTTPGQ
jgi:hypothetical protein